jgi:sortase A
LEIPRLGLSTVVFEGTGQDVLLRGPGHLRGSALPSDTGNMVIAGHRDTFFVRFKIYEKATRSVFRLHRALDVTRSHPHRS